MPDIETIIKKLAEPITDELEVDLMGILVAGDKGAKRVRVVVDKKGGVSVDVLRSLSKGLSLQLDAEDLIAGKYHLEISSPGLDWPLTTSQDFMRYEGDWLKVSFTDGRPVLEGENLGLDSAGCLRIGTKHGEQMVDLKQTQKIIRTINWEKVAGRQKQKKSNAKQKS